MEARATLRGGRISSGVVMTFIVAWFQVDGGSFTEHFVVGY